MPYQFSKKMMTAVGVPGTASLASQFAVPTAPNTSAIMAAAAAAAVNSANAGAASVSNGTSSSSLCSTPVNLFGQNCAAAHLGYLQPGVMPFNNYVLSNLATGLPVATPVTNPLGAGNAFEGLPIFMMPQNSALPLTAIQKSLLAQQQLASAPKIDTSKHFHVFVGDLSSEVDNSMLKAAFDKFGEISEVKVIRDAQSLKPRGYGFVTFPKKEDAEKAIQEMNGQLVGRRAVRTNWATRRTPEDEKKALSYEQIFNATGSDNTTVYLGNLASTATETSVREAFLKFGAIKEIRLFAQQNYGFVTYDTKEQATVAILEMSFEDFEGQMLRCSWGRPAETTNNAIATPTSMLSFGQIAGLSQIAAANAATAAAAAAPAIPVTQWNPLYPTFYAPNLLPSWH